MVRTQGIFHHPQGLFKEALSLCVFLAFEAKARQIVESHGDVSVPRSKELLVDCLRVLVAFLGGIKVLERLMQPTQPIELLSDHGMVPPEDLYQSLRGGVKLLRVLVSLNLIVEVG